MTGIWLPQSETPLGQGIQIVFTWSVAAEAELTASEGAFWPCSPALA